MTLLTDPANRRMRATNRGPVLSDWARDALTAIALVIFIACCIGLQLVCGGAS